VDFDAQTNLLVATCNDCKNPGIYYYDNRDLSLVQFFELPAL